MNIGNKNISSWNITNSGKTLVMGF